jgi:prevent-host-death family protein
MEEIGVRELKENASEVLRRVREEKATYRITYRGRVVAELAPTADPQHEREEWERIWAEMDETAAQISEKWPKGVSAVDAVREQRREL